MRTTLSATFPFFSLTLGAVNWSALESCVTQSGTSSVKSVSTSVLTTTIVQPNVVLKHTFHPTHLVTPLPFTEIWTHTYHEFDTAISTVTVTLTQKVVRPTSTIVSTVTLTENSIVSSTIPLPSGFLPISDTTDATYPAAVPAESKPTASHWTTAVSNTTATVGVSASASVGIEAREARLLPGPVGKEFAHLVHCVKSVLVQTTMNSTVTGATQTRTLPQSTTTTTVSATATAMVKPQFGLGRTVYTTVWTTVTKNINAYSIQTVTAEVTSTVTAYAACQTGNLLSSIASISATGSDEAQFKIAAASSAEDCCEQCQKTSDCSGSAYQQLGPFGGGRCLIYYSDSCSAQSAYSLEYVTSASGPGVSQSFVVSNGLCGYMYLASQASSFAHSHNWP